MPETCIALLITQRPTVPDPCQNGTDVGGLQRSPADSANDGQAGPKQVDPLSETAS